MTEDRFKLSHVLTGPQAHPCFICGGESVGAFHYRNAAHPEKRIRDMTLCAYHFVGSIYQFRIPPAMLTDEAFDIIERRREFLARYHFHVGSF